MKRSIFHLFSVVLVCLTAGARVAYGERVERTDTYDVSASSTDTDQMPSAVIVSSGQCQNFTKSFTLDSVSAAQITKLRLEASMPDFFDLELQGATKSGNTFSHQLRICVEPGTPPGSYDVDMTFIFLDALGDEVTRRSHTEVVTVLGETIPIAPDSLSATATSPNQIDLSWHDRSSNEDGFKIERSLTLTSGFSEIATVGANKTSFSNSGLSPSTTYYYRVRAYNSGGNSSYSNTSSATTLPTDLPVGNSLVYPQLALGGGYEVALFVSNATTTSWSGTVVLRKDDSQEWASPWSLNGIDRTGSSSFDVHLGPNASQKFRLTSEAEVRVGYMRISAESADRIEDISTSFFYDVTTQGRIVDSIGIAPGTASRRFTCPVERNDNALTGFAWAPDSESSGFLVNLALYDSQGNMVRSVTLPFEGHTAKFFHEVFDNFPDNFVGKVEVTSEQKIHLTALRLCWTEDGFQLTSLTPSLE